MYDPTILLRTYINFLYIHHNFTIGAHKWLHSKFKVLVEGGSIFVTLNDGGIPNIPMQIMGGHIFWDNIQECNGWELQRNTFTGHYRILDPDDIRRAWGSGEALEKIFNKYVKKIFLLKGKIIIKKILIFMIFSINFLFFYSQNILARSIGNKNQFIKNVKVIKGEKYYKEDFHSDSFFNPEEMVEIMNILTEGDMIPFAHMAMGNIEETAEDFVD